MSAKLTSWEAKNGVLPILGVFYIYEYMRCIPSSLFNDAYHRDDIYCTCPSCSCKCGSTVCWNSVVLWLLFVSQALLMVVAHAMCALMVLPVCWPCSLHRRCGV